MLILWLPSTYFIFRGHRGQGEVYSIQHNMIKFVNDLQQVDGFLRVLRCPPQIETDRHDITEILLKMVLSTCTINKQALIFIGLLLLHLIFIFKLHKVCETSSF